MGRHRVPADSTTPEPSGAQRARRRTIGIATALVLTVGAGTFAAMRGGLPSFGGTCGEGTVQLRVAASPDVAPALSQVAREARRTAVKSDGQCLDVTVTGRTASEVSASLGSGSSDGSDFEVWVPDSSAWVDLADADGSSTPVTTISNVASSPIVVGTIAAQAKQLGWPEKTYTWAELTSSAAGSKNLRLGAADPSRSATGLLALAMLNASIARQGGGDTDTRTAGLAKLLAQHSAPGDAEIVATLPGDATKDELDNPKRNQALILSEQAAYQHNTAPGDAPKLDLFFPEDGTADLDYPYTLVDPDQVGTERERAATRFMALLQSKDGLARLATAGFRAPTGQPVTAVLAKAGGRTPQPVDDRPADVPSAQELKRVRTLWQITVQNARLITVVDASFSMARTVPGSGGQTRMEVTKASLLQALSQFTADDEIGLWEFARRLDGGRDYKELVPARALGDTAGQGTTQRSRLTSAFGSLKPVQDGATGLYDSALAIYQAARKTYTPAEFNAVVILTDGANEDSGSISLDALTGRLKKLGDPERPIPLIAIAIGPDADKAACDRMAKATGGAAYRVSDPAQIHQVLLKAVVDASTGATATS
ncbi:MAG: hypothetical protein QOF84_7437 [Streptomyces sp.]|nr:hypothetical protein [Streptomyces sp.]